MPYHPAPISGLDWLIASPLLAAVLRVAVEPTLRGEGVAVAKNAVQDKEVWNMQQIALMSSPPHSSTHPMPQNGINGTALTRDADTERRRIHPDETAGFPSMLVMPSWYTQYWLTDETGSQRRRGLLHWVRASLPWTQVRAAPPSPTEAAALGQQQEPGRADRIAAGADHGFGDREPPCRAH